MNTSPVPVLAHFDWPTPPHFNLLHESSIAAVEPAILTMNDGRELTGSVMRLDTTASVLTFQPGPDQAELTLRFSAFKSVLLLRMIELERVNLNVPTASVALFPKPAMQVSTVHFNDGSELVSNTVASVVRKHGLFLFLSKADNHVQRCFIPFTAIASHHTGEPLGKALVARNIVNSTNVDAGLEKQRQLRSAKLGEYLQRQRIVTGEQLEDALRRRELALHRKLGDALIKARIITGKQRDEALAMQAIDRIKPLGEILVEMGVVSRDAIKRVLVDQLGIPLIHLREFQFDLNAIKAVPAELAYKHTAIPLSRTAKRIVIALEDPLDGEALQAFEFVSDLKVDPVLASHDDLMFMIAKYYGPAQVEGNLGELIAELGEDESSVAAPGQTITESDNTLVKLVNQIILDAVAQGASDIHIEAMPGNKPGRVRFRKDGLLVPYTEIPANWRAAVVSRIKIMSGLDISEKRRPQDGKMNFRQFGPAPLELRVVTIPTANGLEGVVMRLLTAPAAISISHIDLAPRVLANLMTIMLRPFGLLLVCGPTGSGKTTTLHALLSYINTPERKIWTVENPIEITQDGLSQVQVHDKIGLTFAAVLRSFMRADPDVIMVGETRDTETAETVVTASLTGHLVLSTMHTNSAVESVVRLLDFGLDPFSFADALLGIVGQRLVRRLCLNCRVPHSATPAELEQLALAYYLPRGLPAAALIQRWRTDYAGPDGEVKLFSAAGCEDCDHTGYKGRLGMHELLVASPAVKAMIQSKATVAQITQTAIAEGMVTLKQDGIEKVVQGHTDLTQVQAVCI